MRRPWVLMRWGNADTKPARMKTAMGDAAKMGAARPRRRVTIYESNPVLRGVGVPSPQLLLVATPLFHQLIGLLTGHQSRGEHEANNESTDPEEEAFGQSEHCGHVHDDTQRPVNSITRYRSAHRVEQRQHRPPLLLVRFALGQDAGEVVIAWARCACAALQFAFPCISCRFVTLPRTVDPEVAGSSPVTLACKPLSRFVSGVFRSRTFRPPHLPHPHRGATEGGAPHRGVGGYNPRHRDSRRRLRGPFVSSSARPCQIAVDGPAAV